MLLRRRHPDVRVRLVPLTSAGDRDRTTPIAALTERGAFVGAVRRAVLEERADVAVHSLKDVPVEPVAGLVLAAVPEREDPWDVLVGATLDELPAGAEVGTGSPRRAAQLRLLRPDLRTVELRGNIGTRLARVAEGAVAAAVLAAAGLRRLGREDAVTWRFDVEEMVPAPGQGALAVETRSRGPARELVGAIDDVETRLLVEAERALLRATGAGCRAARGALAEGGSTDLRLTAFVADERGARRTVAKGADAEAVVREVRRELGL